jgi:hypothetical protein
MVVNSVRSIQKFGLPLPELFSPTRVRNERKDEDEDEGTEQGFSNYHLARIRLFSADQMSIEITSTIRISQKREESDVSARRPYLIAALITGDFGGGAMTGCLHRLGR